jgi:hypothetical protein
MREHIPAELIEGVRLLELARLDDLFTVMYRQAMDGSRLAVDRCLRIMERRAALVGLDAPLQIRQAVISEDDFSEAIRQLEAEATALDRAGALRGEPEDEDREWRDHRAGDEVLAE